jgi:hypothetical protein
MGAQRNTKRVNLEKLFQWNHELDIRDHEGVVVGKLHQRLLNERGVDQARLAALRATRTLRLELRDPESDEHAAIHENLLQLDKDQQTNVVMLEGMGDLYERARKDVDIRLPMPPVADADLEEVEEYEAEVDSYDARVTEAVVELADQYAKERRTQIEALGEDEFTSAVLKSMENQICMTFMTERFVEEQIWRSVYHDAKYVRPYFDDYESFEGLAKEVRDQLAQGYKDLELQRGELKN